MKWPWLLLLGILAAPAHAAGDALHDSADIERAGDLLQFGVPLAGLALTFMVDDPADAPEQHASFAPGSDFDYHIDGRPRHDLALAMGRMELTTYSLKYSIDEQRPNGGRQSFPSGHTATAFTGAEFIRVNYGWKFGVPAYLAASYVGWSRVATNNHYPQDVYAGALIGIMSNHEFEDFSTPFGVASITPGLMFDASDPALAIDRPLADVEPALAGAPGLSGVGLNFQLRFW